MKTSDRQVHRGPRRWVTWVLAAVLAAGLLALAGRLVLALLVLD